MNRMLHFLALLQFLPLFASAQVAVPGSESRYHVGNYRSQDAQSPKYEYRAVWLTTIEGLDWPRTKVKSPGNVQTQKNELVVLLDSLQAMHINTVLLQVRVRGDVIYPSAIEPFSHVLTGVPGKNPGYDPLAFAIEECHKRGMQLHAWLVTLPLGKLDHVRRLGKDALPSKNSRLCTSYKGSWYMEPGNPATADYLAALVKEIVQNYDVDGIHLDYVRYPDTVDGYPDGALYRKYGKGKSLSAWRRSNVTNIARAIHAAVKGLKPWVRVSCAPLGKYNNLTRYSSYGWDAYNAVYQDAQGWLRDGIMDILFPMLYYKGNHFYPFVRDWCENNHGRHIVPGLGIYRLSPLYGEWPAVEIERQMRTSRSAAADGVMMFRTAHLVGNASGARDIYTKIYNTPALVPPMDWMAPAPGIPSLVECVRDMDGVSLQWDSVPAQEGYPAVRYNVYATLGDSVDIDNGGSLVAVSLADTCYRFNCRTDKDIALAVTAVDACGVESEPLHVVATVAERIVRDNCIGLPELFSPGQHIELFDTYGRVLYIGEPASDFDVRDFAAGCYILNVYNRHGELLYRKEFIR